MDACGVCGGNNICKFETVEIQIGQDMSTLRRDGGVSSVGQRVSYSAALVMLAMISLLIACDSDVFY